MMSRPVVMIWVLVLLPALAIPVFASKDPHPDMLTLSDMRPDLFPGDPIQLNWNTTTFGDSLMLYLSVDHGQSWFRYYGKIANTGRFSTIIPHSPSTHCLWKLIDEEKPAQFLTSRELTGIRPRTESAIDIYKEAEDAVLSGPVKVAIDGNAFNNQCIHGYHVNRRGWAHLEFFVPEDGVYTLWGRVLGMNLVANSFFISMDDSPVFLWDIHKNNQWEWNRVSDRGTGSHADNAQTDPVLFHLSAGRHTLVIGNREKYTRIDRLRLSNNLDADLWNPDPGAWIDLVAPTHGDVIAPGSAVEIKWDSYTASDRVRIDMSLDRGETFAVPIAENTENDGSFIWQVPDYYKLGKVVLRVSDLDGQPYDVNWGYFSIVDPADPNYGIFIQTPAPGDELIANSETTVSWKSFYYNGFVNVYWSIDNGVHWTTMAYVKDASDQRIWQVPNTSSDACLIRVADAFDDHPSAVLPAPFKILPPGSVPSQARTVLLSPSGGEFWRAGSQHNLIWESEHYDGSVRIEFSADNGSTWSLITAQAPASGMFPWILPDLDASACLIRVTAVSATALTAISAPFAIVPEPAPGKDFALLFDGNDDLVTIPNHPSLNVSAEFTIGLWIKTDLPEQNWSRLLEKGSWDEYSLGFYGRKGTIHAALRTLDGDNSRMTIPCGPSQTDVLPQQWTHIAVTFDGSVARLYINAELETEMPATADPRRLSGDLILGAVKHPRGSDFITDYHYRGLLDDLGIYRVARSQTEIAQDMGQAPARNETGLVAFYDFNTGNGQRVEDKSLHFNHGWLGNAQTADDADPQWVESDRLSAQVQAMYPAARTALFVPEIFALLQNYPNPFNNRTAIRFAVPEIPGDHPLSLTIVDIQGRIVWSRQFAARKAGIHEVQWDGRSDTGRAVASGIYFYRLQCGDFQAGKQLVYIK